MQKTHICLSEVGLNDYLSGALSGERRAEVENHLKDCDACLEKLTFAYQAVKEFDETKQKGANPMKNTWKKNIWLFGAVVTFILSFVARPFFLQFLVATILLGAKWIFDSLNARILIMIYDAWKKGGEQEASKILKNLNNRF